MVAASGKNDNELMDNTFKSTVDERITLLRSAAMYGANASGKSNFIKALSFYFAFILRSTESLDGGLLSDQKTFLLDKETTVANSKFEAILELKGAIYRYGYILHEQLVVREWLFCTGQGKQRRRERQLFERDVQANLVKGAGFAKYPNYCQKLVIVDRCRTSTVRACTEFGGLHQESCHGRQPYGSFARPYHKISIFASRAS